MAEVPFHLKYPLSRSQRLVPLFRNRGIVSASFDVIMFGFFAVECVLSMFFGIFQGMALFGGLALCVYLLDRGLFGTLWDVLFVPLRNMDVIIENNAAGILTGAERWYLFLDGITAIRKYRPDTWTIEHFNGMMLQIAASAINDEQLDYLRAAMEQGQTPEGVQAVIERGRKIQQIYRRGRGSKYLGL
jgi:hypothetical protein